MFLFVLILYETLRASWAWVVISFPILRNYSSIISSNIFSHPFLLFSFSRAPMIQMFLLICCPRSLWDCPYFFFTIFYLLCSAPVILFTILTSSSLIHSSASFILPLVPSSVFLISLFCCSLLFFNSLLVSSLIFLCPR